MSDAFEATEFENPSEEEIRRLLERVRRIAVVGLSPKPHRDSHRVARYLLDAGTPSSPSTRARRRSSGRPSTGGSRTSQQDQPEPGREGARIANGSVVSSTDRRPGVRIMSRERVREEWQQVAQGWRRWEPMFESFSWPLALRMASAAAVGAGQRVLDVGCGVGDPTLQVAVLVGPHGRVLGIDIAEGMVAIARERAAALGLAHVEFRVDDITSAELPDAAFDVVLGRWSLIYLDDVPAVLERLRRALVPGGRIAVTAWAPLEVNPWFLVPHEALARLGPVPPLDVSVPGLFHLLDGWRPGAGAGGGGLPDRGAGARRAVAARARRRRVLAHGDGHGRTAGSADRAAVADRCGRGRRRRRGAPRALPRRRSAAHPGPGAARLGTGRSRSASGGIERAEPVGGAQRAAPPDLLLVLQRGEEGDVRRQHRDEASAVVEEADGNAALGRAVAPVHHGVGFEHAGAGRIVRQRRVVQGVQLVLQRRVAGAAPCAGARAFRRRPPARAW